MQFQPDSQGQSATVDWQEWFYSHASVVTNTLDLILLLVLLHHCNSADFSEVIPNLHNFKWPENRSTDIISVWSTSNKKDLLK